MKKRLILATMAAFAVSGAGAQPQQPSKKVLVAYFSHSGNTREVARQIGEATGGDLFEIVPATPYPAEYQAVVDQGKKEIAAGVRPALKNPVGDLSQYDVIFVGSPCWWATIAPPVATFLTSCDFAGKTVIPFMTHEGSGMGRSEADIRKRPSPTDWPSAAARCATRKRPSENGLGRSDWQNDEKRLRQSKPFFIYPQK